MNLPFYIGLRYTRAKKRNHFISFIAMMSMIGIALGVAVLITVMSVMNGFDHEIQDRVLNMVPQVTITGWDGKLNNWQSLQKRLAHNKKIIAMAPFIQAQGMLSTGGSPAFVMMNGIDPVKQSAVSPIASKMIAGKLTDLTPGKFDIILGYDLANNLGVTVGNKVTVYVPKATLSPIGMLPRFKQFKVVGIFKVGYQFDNSYALINIHDAAKLMMMPKKVSGLQLKLTNLFLAPKVAYELNQHLPFGYRSFDWTAQNANFFKALKMEKVMMFLILALIIAVAVFNMLSSLVMTVTDKYADIAILRTLGASSRTLMGVFVVQGVVIGLVGIILGTICGVELAWHVTSIVNHIQQLFHVQFLNSNVYYINFLPSRLYWSDVVTICTVAFGLSFLATLYPAWRASKINPVEALRYE